MAATFYVEPLLTFDLGVFVLLPPSASGSISLAAIYDALRVRGYSEQQDCVLIEGVPVQFLPAHNSLVEEAVAEAHEVDYEDVRMRVVQAEHLAAICLQTGRDKDRERVRLLRTQGRMEPGRLADLLRRHNLEEKWKSWTE
jgi:hypothetical protein